MAAGAMTRRSRERVDDVLADRQDVLADRQVVGRIGL